MPGFSTANNKRIISLIAGLLGLAVLFYVMPLFHVVPLKAARQESARAVFDAAAYTDSFWTGPLMESARQAVDSAQLLAAFRQDPVAATARYGHRLGLSSYASFFVSGTGRIVAVDEDAVSIALQEGDPPAVIIETGPVFGNAIRDGSGLLDVSDFSNAQDFNAISAEINRRVEEQIFPVLEAHAAVGATVHFVGGADVADSEGAPASLNLVPVVIEFP